MNEKQRHVVAPGRRHGGGRRRPLMVGASTVALAAATLFAGPGTVQAQPLDGASAPVAATAQQSASQTYEIVSTADGKLQAPDEVPAGRTTFRMATEDPESGWVGLARPKPGTTWTEFRSALTSTINGATAEEIVAGSEELDRIADVVGGTTIHPDLPATFERNLEPGTYWVFDYLHILGDTPRYRTLTVTENGSTASSASGGQEQRTGQGVITAEHVNGSAAFTVSGRIAAGESIRFENELPGIQGMEAILFPLDDSVTDADLREYFASFGDIGQFPDGEAPFDLGAGTGMLPLSAGEGGSMTPTLQPGRYVVVNWLERADTGASMVKQGHWTTVTVH